MSARLIQHIASEGFQSTKTDISEIPPVSTSDIAGSYSSNSMFGISKIVCAAGAPTNDQDIINYFILQIITPKCPLVFTSTLWSEKVKRR